VITNRKTTTNPIKAGVPHIMEMSSMMTSRSIAKPKTRTAYAPTMQPFAPRYRHRSSLFTLIG
ncbi:uncharacterized protein METZ01_LOCUS200465, partial [marine metagenome]